MIGIEPGVNDRCAHSPDPRPEPPLPPEPDACCGSGCNPCVYDLHDAALERYRAALRAWQERHPEREVQPCKVQQRKYGYSASDAELGLG